jgi:hypothetical protein
VDSNLLQIQLAGILLLTDHHELIYAEGRKWNIGWKFIRLTVDTIRNA